LADRRSPEGPVIRSARAARAQDGAALSQEELEIELHHFMLGSFQVLVGGFAGLVTALADHPDVQARAANELRRQAWHGQPSVERLGDLTYQRQIVKEVRRIGTLIAHSFFARARESCEFRGRTIPKDAIAVASLHATMHDPALFRNPDVFDPDRFGPERAEDARENCFVPHGGGPWTGHRCPGEGLSELILQSFTTRLLRDYTWQLPPHSRALGMGITVPLPIGGIPVRFRRA
jgi:cytochrome P450